MIKFFERIKSKLFEHKSNYVYWVNIKDIIIKDDFKETPPRNDKMEMKWKYYRDYNELESSILLNKDFVLLDGYTSYLIAELEGMRKVPVYFVD